MDCTVALPRAIPQLLPITYYLKNRRAILFLPITTTLIVCYFRDNRARASRFFARKIAHITAFFRLFIAIAFTFTTAITSATAKCKFHFVIRNKFKPHHAFNGASHRSVDVKKFANISIFSHRKLNFFALRIQNMRK